MKPHATASAAVLLCALAAFSHPRAQARVWIVDDDGVGAQFTSIQPAIDAASSGDVILVRTGDYAEFTLAGKGLSIVGDEDAAVRVLATPGSITTLVSGIPAGQRAMIRRIAFVPPDRVVGNLVRVERSAGIVWFEDIVLAPPISIPIVYSMNQTEAMKVADCDQVVIVNTEIHGSDGAPPGMGLEIGSVGLTAEDSTVLVHGGRILAGQTVVAGGTGLTALRAMGGVVALRDVEVLAADGGASGVFGSPPPGAGGPGVTISEGATVWAINARFVGGAGGTSFLGGPVGNPGAPALIISGSLFESVGDPVRLTTTTVAGVGDEARFDLQAVPDSVAFLLIRLFGSDPVFVGGLPGFLGVGSTPLIAALGTTGPLGQLSVELRIPPLPPGLLTWDATVQMAVITPVPRFELSNPSILTVVDTR